MDTPSIPLKLCKKCGQEYPKTNEFWHRDKGAKDGLCYTCKECAKARARKWGTDNHEYALERHRQYYQDNAETIKARARKWEAENVERKKERSRQYYRDNKERLDQKNKEWAQRNPDKRREIHERWLKANPDRRKEHANKHARSARGNANRHQWRENNPMRYRALNKANKARRRAQMIDAEGTHTAEDIQRQYKSQKGRCWWCGKEVGKDYHADHLIPINRGGTNWPNNIVIACPHCNSSRQDKLPHEWNGRLL